MNIVYALGVFLLYMPPFMVFVSQHILCRFKYFLLPERAIWLTVPLTSFMLVLLPQAWIAWLSYWAIFNFMNKYAYMKLGDPVKAFSLSVYACFAVSVLWEWPIQASLYPAMIQLNPAYRDALYMSSFKALGILFFFYTIYKLGWSNKLFQLMLALSFIYIGWWLWVILAFSSSISELTFIGLHLYRLPWFFLLLYAIPDKHLNKSTVPEG